MAETIDFTRVAGNVCIYWTGKQDLSETLQESISGVGVCTAISHFTQSQITCFNNGNCNGAGTCRNCSAYDVGGLQYSHKQTTHVYSETCLLEWNSTLNKYVPVRQLNQDEVSDGSAFVDRLTWSQKTTTLNISGEQSPINLVIYNLRARLHKCCNWNSTPFMYVKNKSGVLLARVFSSSSVSDASYLAKDDEGNYVVANALSANCSVAAATPWKLPFTIENPTAYGCNGCKPECPFYTGPKWTYCVDSRMQMGDTVSAYQILELRFYSDDWSKYPYPEDEYRKKFKDPEIFAWTGKFEFGGDTTNDLEDNPMVRRVYISDFSGASPIIAIDPPEPADKGLRVFGDVPETTVAYPTLIKELYEMAARLKIVWPKNTTNNDPFMFRTFRIGQNTLRIYIDTPYISTLYAVNTTTHDQGSVSDGDFIQYMIKYHPGDLHSVAGSGTTLMVQYFDVDLEYKPEVNVIKAFTRDPTSDTGAYLTDTCFIQHKLYHGMIAQTLGRDEAGFAKLQPWIDRFERVYCQAQVLQISNSPSVQKVIWYSDAGGKLSMYPVEKIYINQRMENWVSISCGFAAVTFDNLECSAVIPWTAFGESPRGVTLGMYVDRQGNPAAASDGIVLLKLIAQSYTGSVLPGNVLIVGPAFGNWSSGLDEKTDVIYATYYTTEYKQSPVVPEDKLSLKYPNAINSYMNELPIEMEFNGTNFSARGSSVCLKKTEKDITSYERIYDITDVKERMYNELLAEETASIDSFHRGGVADKSIRSSSEIFDTIKEEFEDKYSGFVFCSDGAKVILSEVCSRLGNLKYHEGDYTFVFFFEDETGRLLGYKRVAMLLQAAIPETRDVEIRYRWEMKLLSWRIKDAYLLLAKYNLPMEPDPGFEGTEHYNPRCGDHGEEFLKTHYFGDPGPMWYPYISCLSPRYHEDGINIAVKCKNLVEGFGASTNPDGSISSLDTTGKRWSYWERMRGNDMLTTHISSTIFLVGCMYREISWSYQLTDEQRFDGYTRIRSGHPHAPNAKDREALRVSRHFLKRNLKVRNEVVSDLLSPLEVGWTEEYKQLIFTDPNDTDKGILVGDQQETPIWVHLSDGISVVNRTTAERQHPFCHYTLDYVGIHDFSETFDTSEDNRYKLSEVIQDRDLTSVQCRNPQGTLVYSAGEPIYCDDYENYNDIVPVYSNNTTAWGWLERPKDPIRGSNSIGGINIYNPTVNVWKTDRESATYTEEGVNSLHYTPPVFDKTTGYISELPTFSWASGPSRQFDWYSGKWVEDAGVPIVSIYNSLYNGPGFNFFGRGNQGHAFLMDDTGVQTYVYSVTNSGIQFKQTSRGVGVDVELQTDLLPYVLSDLVEDIPSVYLDVIRINEIFSTITSHSFLAKCLGHFYVESVDIIWKFGPGTAQDNNGIWIDIRYDIPKLSIYALVLSPGGVPISAGLVSSTDYQMSTQQELQEVTDESGIIYTYKGAGFKKVNYPVESFAGTVRLDFGSFRADARGHIEKIEIWYRKPVESIEGITNYEQKVNISIGNTGTPDYREMLYFYSRTLVDYGDGLAYNALEGAAIPGTPGSLSPDLKSVKFTSRSVRDVVLEYEYSDPTSTRFPYNSKVHPQESSIATEDLDGYWSVPSNLAVCTKSRTLYANSHVNDNPEWVIEGGKTVKNKKAVADNETSSCAANKVGPYKMGEKVQECLYEEARGLLGGDVKTVYSWFWHPDEIAFWEDIMGVYLPGKELKLILHSVVPEFYRVYQHEHFGCISNLSTTYSDGHLHEIPPWRALGHRLYSGSPKFNRACWDVVVFKIEEHIGEKTYGTSAYGGHAAAGGTLWPSQTYRDKDHYLQNDMIEKGGYIGGAIGGAGPLFWVAQTQLSHGFTLPQLDTQAETTEAVYGGREESMRADASRDHMHSDEPPVGNGIREYV